MPTFTSLISSSAGVASPGSLASTMRSTSLPEPRMTRPNVPGSSSSVVITVAAAPASSWAATSAARSDPCSRGVSPDRTSTVSLAATKSRAARIAPPVPSELGCTTVSVPSGRAAERSWSGETITQTRSAPASRAAWMGQATIGRPQTSCRTLGVSDRIRVPWPAAMIKAVGALTPEA